MAPHSVKILKIRAVQGKSLHDSLPLFPQLEKLELVKCPNLKLHSLADTNPLLEFLMVTGSGLKQFPLEILALKKLSYLRLNRCNLEEITDSWDGFLPPLEELHLGENRLQKIPTWVGGLSHLKVLSVPKNQICELPMSLKNCFQLNRLNLDNNLIDDIPNFLTELRKLSHLSLDSNPLNEQGKEKIERLLPAYPID